MALRYNILKKIWILTSFLVGSSLFSFNSTVYLSPLMTNRKGFLQAYIKRTVDGFVVKKERHPLWVRAVLKNHPFLREPIKAYEPFHYKVRVLLDEQDEGSSDMWTLTSSSGFCVIDSAFPDKKYLFKYPQITISRSHSLWRVNDCKLTGPLLYVQPAEGNVTVSGEEYKGNFILAHKNGKLQLINQVDIEDYVYSVIRYESWPGWPVEVNKAFAIAIRSYVIAKILERKKNKQHYHIKNSNVHQTYKGVHTSPILKQAVEETQGLILTHNKKPIVAMFDCCCGGIIPAHIAEVNHTQAPYLSRSYPCNFCKSCKIYTWNLEYTTEELLDLLHIKARADTDIRDIVIKKRDRAGIVQKVSIATKHREYIFSGKQLYSLIQRIKSFCYSVKKVGKKIQFSGKGYGHHLGICQWGARRMLDHGYTFKDMLSFYYPSTTIMALRQLND
jgi:stage II sporulation protein D